MERSTSSLSHIQPIDLTFNAMPPQQQTSTRTAAVLHAEDDCPPWTAVALEQMDADASNQSAVCSERIRIATGSGSGDTSSAGDVDTEEEREGGGGSSPAVGGRRQGGEDDDDEFTSQRRNRSRVTFVGLDGSTDSDDDALLDDNEDFRKIASRVAQQQPPPPLDPRFVPVAGTSAGIVENDAARQEEETMPPGWQQQQRPTVSRHHLAALSANEVHRIFRRHWEAQQTSILPFQMYRPSGSEEAARSESEQAMRARRHATLVNTTNWNGTPADDVCIPVSLAAAAAQQLPAAAVGLADDDAERVLQPARIATDAAAAPAASTVSRCAGEAAGVTLRPHQINGIRFMWRNLMEGPLQRVPAVGCILAHSMGLGKTGQVVVFLHLMAKHHRRQQLQGGGRSPTSNGPAMTTMSGGPTLLPRVVVVAPKSVLAAWESEFEKWSAFFEPSDRVQLTVMDDRMPKHARVEGFRRMMRNGGVVAIGYEALVFLEKEFIELHVVQGGVSGARGGAPPEPFQHGSAIDLVVCDEGHRLKSSNLDIAKSLSRLNALRRLVLTGTPLQNHLLEYWAMSDFAVPKFFDRRTFLKFFVQPIQKAADANASERDVMVAKKKTFILVQEFANFTQRVDNEPLRAELPPLSEYVITLPLSKLQHSLYMQFLNIVRLEHGARFNVLQAFSYASKICAHPQLLFDGDVAMGTSAAGSSYATLMATPEGYEFSPDDGIKMQVAVKIARAAAAIQEKTLIFSTSTKLLDLLEVLIRKMEHADATSPSYQAAKRPRATEDDETLEVRQREDQPTGRTACPGAAPSQPHAAAASRPQRLKLLRIDGASTAAERERKIEEFQSPNTTYNCFLLSTKAGGVGITVTAATRVILLDCSFNPADDRQAIGRAYRYGQTKPVVVYRLVCRNTIEHRIFDQKVGKEWMFETVINDKNIKRDALSGVKLRHMFLMREARPVAAHEQTTVQSLLPEKVRQATRAIVEADPILRADDVQRSICSVTTFDSYLELDHSEQYGSDEANGYAAYRRSGGLQQADAEDPETRLRLDNEAKSQWTQVKAQSKTLSAIITQLIHERSESSDRIRDYLKKLHVVHDHRFDELQNSGQQQPQHDAMPLGNRRPVAPILLDVTSSDDDLSSDDDVTVVATTAAPTRRQVVAQPPVKSLRPLVDPRAYAPYPPAGSSREHAVDIDDD